MKKIKFLLILQLALLMSVLFSCQSFMPYNGGIPKNVSFPPINTIVTKNIGDILLMQGIETKTIAIQILEDAANGKVLKGTYYASSFRKNANGNYLYRFTGQGIKGFLEYFEEDNSLICSNEKLYPFGTSIKNFKFIKNAIDRYSVDNFQQTLIYLGKTGNTVKFGYREFSGDIARPAFSNEVSYDLNDSDIVGYGTAQIQIIDLTNTSITYKVLSNFN